MQPLPTRPTTMEILKRIEKTENLIQNHVLTRLAAIEQQLAELRGALRFIRWAVPSAVAIVGIIVYRLV